MGWLPHTQLLIGVLDRKGEKEERKTGAFIGEAKLV